MLSVFIWKLLKSLKHYTGIHDIGILKLRKILVNPALYYKLLTPAHN